nr:hypothetical protein Iba_chr13bCG6710 [Ipomoea batatas]
MGSHCLPPIRDVFVPEAIQVLGQDAKCYGTDQRFAAELGSGKWLLALGEGSTQRAFVAASGRFGSDSTPFDSTSIAVPLAAHAVSASPDRCRICGNIAWHNLCSVTKLRWSFGKLCSSGPALLERVRCSLPTLSAWSSASLSLWLIRTLDWGVYVMGGGLPRAYCVFLLASNIILLSVSELEIRLCFYTACLSLDNLTPSYVLQNPVFPPYEALALDYFFVR